MATDPSLLAVPGDLPDCAPAWKVRYARWDGGIPHVAKGMHSHWPYLLEPRSIAAMVRWYTPKTIELLKDAGINWIWVTWSVGFPPEDEELVWPELRDYISNCHEAGIHVTAYVSLANMFRDLWLRRHPESDEWFQRDRQGNLIPYLAAYHPKPRTRFLACLSSPGWQAHVLRIAHLAVDADVDGIMYDNAGSACQCERCLTRFRSFARTHFGREYGELPDFGHMAHGVAAPAPCLPADSTAGRVPDEQSELIWHRFVNHLIGQILSHVGAGVRARKPGILLYNNCNADMDTLSYPANNAVTTEDAVEPGFLAGRPVTNGGLLRLLAAMADGWKPVRVEYAVGHGADESEIKAASLPADWTRFSAMRPRKQNLAIAEAAAYGASCEITPEGYLSVALFFRERGALSNWRAIRKYHDFLGQHEDLYEHSNSTASTGVLLNDDAYYPNDWLRIQLLNTLAAAGLDFDVILDRQVEHTDLSRYSLLVLPDTRFLGDTTIASLVDFSQSGGEMLVTGRSGRYDDYFLPRPEWPLDNLPGLHYRPDINDRRMGDDARDSAALVDAIRSLNNPPAVTVTAASGILTRSVYQEHSRRYVVHLLNYNNAPAGPVRITGKLRPALATLHTPDDGGSSLEMDEGGLRIDRVDTYSVISAPE